MADHTILVIDDDPIGLKVMQLSLERGGFAVVKANTAEEAIEIVQAQGPAAFLAALVDYQLPGLSGLEFLEWVKGVDNALSVVIVTSQSERTLIHTSMRQGATDFLEKPISPKALVEAMGRACEKTIRARQLNTAQKNVRAIAQMNHFFKSVLTPEIIPYIQIHYAPFDQVGGDFVNVLPVAKNKIVMLVGDVSGHDLRAGFVSAYFQGLVRGLCHDSGSIVNICDSFNNILLQEWTRRDGMDKNPFNINPRTTLALLALEIDFAKNTAIVVNCGAPSLKVSYVNGSLDTFESENMPLGWSNQSPIKAQTLSLKDVAYLFLATDGLHDWAERLGTNSLGLAYRLLQKRSTPGGTPPDDLLIFRYQHARDLSSEEIWHPLGYTENIGKLSPKQVAQKLCSILKNDPSQSADLQSIQSSLTKQKKAIKRCCISIRPKDRALKLVTRFADESVSEIEIG